MYDSLRFPVESVGLLFDVALDYDKTRGRTNQRRGEGDVRRT